MSFQVELVWNRETNFRKYGPPRSTIDEAINSAQAIENSGDGARVKKSRVVDSDGKAVWAYGKKVV